MYPAKDFVTSKDEFWSRAWKVWQWDT